MRNVLCVIEERDGLWEAVCLDLDISVAGLSFDDAKHALEAAMARYVATASAEAPADRDRLLNRRAPVSVRLATLARFAAAFVSSRSGRDGKATGAFFQPCPA